MRRPRLTRRTSFIALGIMLGLANVGLMFSPTPARAAEEVIAGCDRCSKCSGRCDGEVRSDCFCCSGLCWRCGDAC